MFDGACRSPFEQNVAHMREQSSFQPQQLQPLKGTAEEQTVSRGAQLSCAYLDLRGLTHSLAVARTTRRVPLMPRSP